MRLVVLGGITYVFTSGMQYYKLRTVFGKAKIAQGKLYWKALFVFLSMAYRDMLFIYKVKLINNL